MEIYAAVVNELPEICNARLGVHLQTNKYFYFEYKPESRLMFVDFEVIFGEMSSKSISSKKVTQN